MASFQKLKSTPFVMDVDKWSWAVAEQSRKNDIALAVRTLPLGGSRHVGVEGTGAQDAIDYPPLLLNGVTLEGFTIRARVEVRTAAGGTSVTPQIYDVTTDAVLEAGTASTSTTWEEHVLVLSPLPLAERRYRLRLVKSNADALVYGIGVLELLAP